MYNVYADLLLVECSANRNCSDQHLGTMTIHECCVDNPAGLAFAHPGSEECHSCTGALTCYHTKTAVYLEM